MAISTYFSFRAKRLSWIALFSLGLTYLALVFGFLVIPPPAKVQSSPKVFGIGLSRTGTTSLTLGLEKLGYRPYHALPKLVSIDEKYKLTRESDFSLATLNEHWANSLDALTDIQVTVVYRVLAERYPDARFILTRRNSKQWGESMLKFCKKMESSLMLSQALYDIGLWNQPADGLFVSVYGEWRNHTKEKWEEIYNELETTVIEYFEKEAHESGRPNRLLQIDLTNDSNKTAFQRLASFLGRKGREFSESTVPKGEVIHHMFTTQVLLQIENLIMHLSNLTWVELYEQVAQASAFLFSFK